MMFNAENLESETDSSPLFVWLLDHLEDVMKIKYNMRITKTSHRERTKTPAVRGLYTGIGKLNSVFEGFEWTRLDHFAGGLGLEHRRLFREGIDALALRHGGLRD
jgi:hypothetical protein